MWYPERDVDGDGFIIVLYFRANFSLGNGEDIYTSKKYSVATKGCTNLKSDIQKVCCTICIRLLALEIISFVSFCVSSAVVYKEGGQYKM